MITALEAHKLSAAKRELRERTRVIDDLANIQRLVMLAVDRGEFSVRVPESTFVARPNDVVAALGPLGYGLSWTRKRKGTEAGLTVSWGAARQVSP